MVSAAPVTPLLQSIAEVSEAREVWLCDIWGVLHNGVEAFPEAAAACHTFRGKGGIVILISNSPRLHDAVAGQLDEFGIASNIFDGIVTSGDVTRTLIEARADTPIFHLGPDRDRGIFEGIPVRFTAVEKARTVVCTGLFDDETESPEDYRDMLAEFASANATFICGNPDLVVERGDRLIPCAGALAALYVSMGKSVLQAGKPYSPIYETALALARAKGWNGVSQTVLAIGDGIDTDIAGAANAGLDAVYIASKVSMGDAGVVKLDANAIKIAFEHRPFRPVAAMAHLGW